MHATTATGDTALTYACENGHTDVADVLLQTGADLVGLPFLSTRLFDSLKICQYHVCPHTTSFKHGWFVMIDCDWATGAGLLLPCSVLLCFHRVL